MKMSGNTILITGGATGIGIALAERLLELGNIVVICGRREERLREAKALHPGLHTFICDVATIDGRERLFKWVTLEFPKLNILVNNAGIQKDIDFRKGLEDLLADDNEISINFEAPVMLTAMFMKQLELNENPVIINVTSGLAFRPMPAVPIYCATKVAMHTYTMLLRQQLSNTAFKVFEVIPPAVESELNVKGRKKRGLGIKLVSSTTFADAVIAGLEKDDPEIRYGVTRI